MAKARSPNRDKAFAIWQEHGGNITNREIAQILNEDEKKIAVWKQRDKWNVVQHSKDCCTTKKAGAPKGNKNAAGHGAPVGNKNAVGNNGGPPLGNKNAVTTGEFETIWLDCLDADEQAMYEKIDTDELVQTEEAIRLLTLRERRMLKRIQDLMNGLSEKARSIVMNSRNKKELIQVFDEKTGKTKVVSTNVPELAIESINETEYRKIDDILSIEEALTRIQDKKTKQLQLKHDLELDKQKLLIEQQKLEIYKSKNGGADKNEPIKITIKRKVKTDD